MWGEAGVSLLPERPDSSTSDLLAVAAQDLVESALSGAPHEVDATFCARIVELLADAQAQIDAARGS